ncbi:MAG: restriction endonuclease [Nitrospiraceae bacterium]|nr:restriction endonuclease [Nitrospiraceae bacterium]
MRLRLERFSFRFADQVLNSKLAIKQEIEDILTEPSIKIPSLSRPTFNKVLKDLFVAKGWKDQPDVFQDDDEPSARMDFLEERVGIEVGFGHASFLGIDLLKFQVSSYSALDQIDLGIYITTTKSFQKQMKTQYNKKWAGSLTFEKVAKYLPHFKSAIQLLIYVIGIDI